VDFQVRTVTVQEVLEDVRRNGVQTKKNRNESSIYDNYVTCVGVLDAPALAHARHADVAVSEVP